MLWIILSILTMIATGCFLIYLISRFSRFEIVRRLALQDKKKIRIIAILIVVILSVVLIVVFDTLNAIIILLHLGVIWLIVEGIITLINKKRKSDSKYYLAGILTLCITFVYLCIGWYQAHHVWEKDYEVATDKAVGDFRVVLFADSHIGTTFDGKGLSEHIDEIQKSNPDIVVIAGDFVDDDTTYEDMIDGCKSLSRLNPRYGVYYVFGNHDKGYYSDARRGFGEKELVNELKANGVRILEDETILIDDRLYLIGRQDRSEDQRGNGRADMDELVSKLDKSKYMLVLDHQPNDYSAQEAAGVDLVLSGHTHGGQCIPATYVGEWINANDKTYGIERRTNTNYIVTSGISDWAVKFKTGCRSEYVVIDIKGE